MCTAMCTDLLRSPSLHYAVQGGVKCGLSQTFNPALVRKCIKRTFLLCFKKEENEEETNKSALEEMNMERVNLEVLAKTDVSFIIFEVNFFVINETLL